MSGTAIGVIFFGFLLVLLLQVLRVPIAISMLITGAAGYVTMAGWMPLLFAPMVPHAQETSPDALVKGVTEDVLSILREKKELQAGNHRKATALIEEKIGPHFNFHRMTGLPPSRSASIAASARATAPGRSTTSPSTTSAWSPATATRSRPRLPRVAPMAPHKVGCKVRTRRHETGAGRAGAESVRARRHLYAFNGVPGRSSAAA